MSTIIRRAFRVCAQVALVLGIWVVLLLAMPFVGPSGRQVAVIGERNAAVRAIVAAGGQIVEPRDGATIAKSSDPRFVRRLYGAGARAVIEGRIAGGCLGKAGE